MENPVRVAFCPILFWINGGQFDELGRPLINEKDDDDERNVRGKCDVPFDCGTCTYLIRWIREQIKQGWSVGWECIECLKDEVPVGKKADKAKRRVPGYYQSSRFRYYPEFWEEEEPTNLLPGCTKCGKGSSLLQLILRRL